LFWVVCLFFLILFVLVGKKIVCISLAGVLVED